MREKQEVIDAQGLVGRELARALQGLQFGAVELTVHDGRVVQIERREKFRLDPPTGRDRSRPYSN